MFSELWDTAAGIGADPTFDQLRTADTVPTNAITSMQPVQSTGGEWGDFWRGTLGSIVSYGLARDAARQGIAQPASPAPGYVPATAEPVAVGGGQGLGLGVVAVVAVVGLALLLRR